VYTLKILNKSQQTETYTISVDGLDGHKFNGNSKVKVKGGEVLNLPISIEINPYKLEKTVTEFTFVLTLDNQQEPTLTIKQDSKFLYPDL
jgi:polyferredoxin